jgi:hypothetical protein
VALQHLKSHFPVSPLYLKMCLFWQCLFSFHLWSQLTKEALLHIHISDLGLTQDSTCRSNCKKTLQSNACCCPQCHETGAHSAFILTGRLTSSKNILRVDKLEEHTASCRSFSSDRGSSLLIISKNSVTAYLSFPCQLHKKDGCQKAAWLNKIPDSKHV